MNDNTITAGTVLVSSWGYDQTNVDFYEVQKVANGWAWIQPIGQETVETTSYLSETVIPNSQPHGKIFRRKVRSFSSGDYVAITDYASAKPWNGKPKYQSHTH